MPKNGKTNFEGYADSIPAVDADKNRGATLGKKNVNIAGEKDTVPMGGTGKSWTGEMDSISGMGK